MNSNKTIPIRVTEKEKEQIENYVKSLPYSYRYQKMNVSKFIRKLVFDEIYRNKTLMKN